MLNTEFWMQKVSSRPCGEIFLVRTWKRENRRENQETRQKFWILNGCICKLYTENRLLNTITFEPWTLNSKGCHFDWSEAKWRNLVDWDFSTSFHCARNDKILGNDNLYPKFRCFAIRIGKIDQKKQDPRLRIKMLNFKCWILS